MLRTQNSQLEILVYFNELPKYVELVFAYVLILYLLFLEIFDIVFLEKLVRTVLKVI